MDGENHSIFVHGMTEVEVKFMRELLETFCKDRKRKWLTYTMKNTKCDDNVSVLTILLIQPCPPGEEVTVQQYNRTVCVEEPPLILSRSDKCTKHDHKERHIADEAKESAVMLKSCMEITKQNPVESFSKAVHYCQSRATQLLCKCFHEKNKMTETVDMDKQLQHSGESLTCIHTNYYSNDDHKKEEPRIDAVSGIVYSLGPPFPSFMLNNCQPENSHNDLIRFLELRLKKRAQLVTNLSKNQNDFHSSLMGIQKENNLLSHQNHNYKEDLDKERKNVNSLESKLSLLKSHLATFQKDMDDKELVINILAQKLNEKELMLKQLAQEKRLIKQKYSSLLVSETEEISQKMQKQLKIQSKLKKHLKEKDKTLKHIRQILDIGPTASHSPASTLERSQSLEDVGSGGTTMGADKSAQAEILRQPRKPSN